MYAAYTDLYLTKGIVTNNKAMIHMMQLLSLKCPECSGNLHDTDVEHGECPFCGVGIKMVDSGSVTSQPKKAIRLTAPAKAISCLVPPGIEHASMDDLVKHVRNNASGENGPIKKVVRVLSPRLDRPTSILINEGMERMTVSSLLEAAAMQFDTEKGYERHAAVMRDGAKSGRSFQRTRGVSTVPADDLQYFMRQAAGSSGQQVFVADIDIS